MASQVGVDGMALSTGALVHDLMAPVVWGTPSPLSLSHIMLQGSSRFGKDSDYYAD